MRTFAAILAALALTAGWTTTSRAEEQSTPSEPTTMQAQCFERGDLLFALATEQGERLAQTRHVGKNGLLEAFKSPSEGTWTIVYSNDQDLSCIIAEGEGLSLDEEEESAPEFGV